MTAHAEFWTNLTEIDARILQAVIGGGFVALGWIINGIRNRRAEARLRAEQVRDLHKALYAEIKSYIVALKRDKLEVFETEMTEKMLGKDPETGQAFIPLIPRESSDAVFSAAIGNIHILPRQTIDPIVAYYSQLKTISTLIEDMRSEDFRNISASRRIAVYRDYIRLKAVAKDMGEYAQRLIAVYAEGGKQAANDLIKKEWVARHSMNAAKEWSDNLTINNQAEASSDQ